MKRIGIIGGSFNPVHIGHLIIAERFIEEIHLDKCYFVPSYVSPFKENEILDYGISAEHRLNMVKAAIQSDPKFEFDDYEIRNKGISYSIDTINYFNKKFPDSELFLLIGEDQLREFKKWKDWQIILKIVRLCISRRPFINKISDEVELKVIHEQMTVNSKEPIMLNSPVMEISSTDIRNRIFLEMSIKYLVTDEVERYIIQNHLYE